jgi:hypothetical protein
MPTELAGHNIKEWSLILLLISVGFTFSVIGIGLALAISSGATISFTGTFDLSQYQTVLLGIAMVAVTLIGQQLTARQVSNAVEQTDKAWIESENPSKKPPGG